MKRTNIVIILFVFSILFTYAPSCYADDTSLKPDAASSTKAKTPYDSITWHDVNKKREKREDGLFSRFHRYFFRTKKIETVTDGNVSVYDSVSYSDDDDQQSPIGVIAVHADSE